MKPALALLALPLALSCSPALYAAKVGTLTCTGATIVVSYYDVSLLTTKLTIHTDLKSSVNFQSLGAGGILSSCTLTDGNVTYTMGSVSLTSANAFAGAASTGSAAGAISYVQAIFTINGLSITTPSGSTGGLTGGDDGGWNRVTNTSDSGAAPTT